MDRQIQEAFRHFSAQPSKLSYQAYALAASRADQAYKCFFCPKMNLSEQMLVCNCGAHSCPDCSMNFVCGDADCSEVACPDCLEKCPACQLNICPGYHHTTCAKCNVEFCLDCTAYCEDCGDLYCLDHVDTDTYTCQQCLA